MLKNTIAKKDVIKCDAKLLNLFAAKKNDAWLLSADDIATKLKAGGVTGDIHAMINPHEMMSITWGLQEWLAFKRMPPLKTKQIHILVVVPGLGGDEIERSRLINAKCRAGKEKKADQGASTKGKRRDSDSYVPLSSFNWTEIGPVMLMERCTLEPTAFTERDAKELRARIQFLTEAYGAVLSTNEAVIETVCRVLDDITVLVEETIVGENVHVTEDLSLCSIIIDVKRADLNQGMAQNLVGLEALADYKLLSGGLPDAQSQ